ncbi:S41 family peptidase [Patescibacteria group bacterium]|nr:S41 family peptidase [Patescibacteria group bacterium]
MKINKIQILVIILITFLLGYYLGTSKVSLAWKSYAPRLNIESKDPPPSISNVDFNHFWTVWQKLENTYYDKSKLDSQKMLNGAISGMVQSLGDPFTVYLPPVQNSNFKEGMAGQFTGIGAELGMKGNDVIVIAPLTGSPAEKSGIKSGDTIVKVNEDSALGWSLTQAVEKIRGPKGTEVILTVVHKDANKTSKIKITRDIITIKSVDGWVKKISDVDKISDSIKKENGENTLTYIRLSQFGDSTNKDWTSLINDLNIKTTSSKNFKGIILDLRNNPGGYLTDAVFISSEFLEIGKPVVSEDTGFDKKSLNVTRKGLFLNYPIVVLVNRGSASASEIVAAALRDNRKIKLIGETTFGKGTIQQAEDLGAGAGLHVTIAKWLTPNNEWVNGKGLKPDIAIDLDEKNKEIDTQLEKAILELVK